MTDENIKKFQEWLTNECRPQLSEDGCYMIEPSGYDDRMSPTFIKKAFDKFVDDQYSGTPEYDSFRGFLAGKAWEEDLFDTNAYESEFFKYNEDQMPDDIAAIYEELKEDSIEYEIFEKYGGYNGINIDIEKFVPKLDLNICLGTYEDWNHEHTLLKYLLPNDLSGMLSWDNDCYDTFMTYLLHQQGYKISDILNYRYRQQGTDPTGFKTALCDELNNYGYSMAQLTFLIKTDNLDLLDALAKGLASEAEITADNVSDETGLFLSFDKSVMFGIFEPWAGGGSLLEMKLDKPLVVPAGFVKGVQIEGAGKGLNRGWTVNDVYGLMNSCWTEACCVTEKIPVLTMREKPEDIIAQLAQIKAELDKEVGNL